MNLVTWWHGARAAIVSLPSVSRDGIEGVKGATPDWRTCEALTEMCHPGSKVVIETSMYQCQGTVQ